MPTTIKGKMFSGGLRDYDDFFAYGPGAMAWGKDAHGRRVLYFLAPASACRFEGARIYAETDGKDWTVPGSVKGWDGNEDRPTFSPSIWLSDRDGWHGYIRAGDLHTV